MRHLMAATLALLLGADTTAAPPAPAGVWRAAPELQPLFAPAGPRAARYRTFTSPLELEEVLRRLSAEPMLLRPPGAWQARALIWSDAFGQTGRYDRWKLARLYGARRPQVARGPVGEGTRVTAAWTLVSPYPDPALDRLQSGTLLIVLSLDGS